MVASKSQDVEGRDQASAAPSWALVVSSCSRVVTLQASEKLPICTLRLSPPYPLSFLSLVTAHLSPKP